MSAADDDFFFRGMLKNAIRGLSKRSKEIQGWMDKLEHHVNTHADELRDDLNGIDEAAMHLQMVMIVEHGGAWEKVKHAYFEVEGFIDRNTTKDATGAGVAKGTEGSDNKGGEEAAGSDASEEEKNDGGAAAQT